MSRPSCLRSLQAAACGPRAGAVHSGAALYRGFLADRSLAGRFPARLVTHWWLAARLRCAPELWLRRSFCSGDDRGRLVDDRFGDVRPKAKPVDTTTRLNNSMDSRFVERRIEEHVRELERRRAAGEAVEPDVAEGLRPEAEAKAQGGRQEAAQAEAPVGEAAGGGAGVPAASGSTAPAEARPQAEALRLVDPDSQIDKEAGKEMIVRSRTTTGQVLWPATPEDIEILSSSKQLYPAPYEVEGSVIIRLVRLSDPVTSPVGRVIRNRQFGIRGNEKWQLLAIGVISTLGIYSLGLWQLRRMEWKKNLIEMRRERLAMPRVPLKGSPFPWKDQVQDYVYRLVEVRGVFDHRREMLIGPRPGADDTGATSSGYLVVTPLRLEDGSTVLVNRGYVPGARADPETRPEVPTWVRLRGILEEGEVPNIVGEYARLKNRPDRNMFMYLISEELAENAGARNHKECQQALITCTDCLYEDDFKAGMRREMPFVMRHKEDYLLFWADEHTHFNYACQWFALGSLIMTMTIYKFIEVTRWRY